MAFLAGLKKELADELDLQQRNVLLQLLHKRLTTLTLEELRQLLVSPLGRGLGSLRLAEIRDGVAQVPSHVDKVRSPRAGKRNNTAKKAKPRKTGSKQNQAAHQVKAPKRRIASPSLVESVAEALVAADRALTTAELAELVRSHPVSIRRALLGLIEARRVVTDGPPTRLRYRLATTTVATEPATDDDLEGRVLAHLREATTGVSLGQLVAQLGASEKRVRTAVRRLESTGRVQRAGERGQTRYSTSGA